MSKQLKKEAWQFYSQWRKEKTYSPALKSEIGVSLLGWNHIIGKNSDPKRSLQEVNIRLNLLPYARQIIKESTTVQDVEVKRGKIYYAIESVIIVGSKSADKMAPKLIARVIIIEDKTGKKSFYSVFIVYKKWSASHFPRYRTS